MGLIARLARGLRAMARPVATTTFPGGLVIGLLIALFTLAATGVAGLQQNASIEDDRANRASVLIGTEAIGGEVSRVIQSASDYGVYRRWYEELQRAAWAQQQVAANPQNAQYLLLLASAESEIATWARDFSPLLQPPYFDPATSATDFASYAAERTVGPTIRAREMRDIQSDLSTAWDAKSSTYVTILTLLAVALFFIGIASTINTRARPVLAAIGTALGVVAVTWAVVEVAKPIDAVPDSAVDQVVTARVELAKATGTTTASLTDDQRKHYEAALAAADAAVSAHADYLSARLARAQVRLAFGNAVRADAGGPTDESQSLLKGAFDDYEVYSGRRTDDYATFWNLGVAAYLAGDYDASLAASDRAIALSPRQFPLYLNRAIAELALGRPQDSDADVQRGIDVAVNSGLDSNAGYFVQEDLGLARLADQRPEDAAAIRDIQRRLREALVAFRATGQASADAAAPRIDSTAVSTLRLGQDGKPAAGKAVDDGATLHPSDANGLRLVLSGALDRDRTVSVRVWRDGLLDGNYTLDESWPASGPSHTIDLLSPFGRAGYGLDAGAYTLEIYLDGATRATVNWTVAAQ